MIISSSFINKDGQSKSSPTFRGVPANPKYIPEVIGQIGKVAGEYIHTPEQKLFLGLAALMFQPFIDLKYAKDDKKTDAAIKSASKAMAGVITGVTIRALFLKLVDEYIGLDKHNLLNRLFKPKDIIQINMTDPAMAQLRMKQYKQALGTIFAIMFMLLFSNSKIDVPLTSDFQDLLSGMVNEDKTFIKSLSEVLDNRKKKISDWFNKKSQIFKNIGNKLKNIVYIIFDKSDKQDKKESDL